MKTMKKNNRLKKTKYKRQMKNNNFIKTKYRIQTKQIQYGGKKYVDGTIPGYQEIKEVIEINYTNAQDELQKLRAHRFYIQKYENVIPESLPENTLIRLQTKTFFSSKVECDDNTYLKLASLNLEKIIKDVLHWNPFLNFPYNYEKYEPYDVYLHTSKQRVEDKLGIDGPFYLQDFFDHSWWNSQKWWVDTKNDERIFPQEKARVLKAKELEHEQRMAARREQAVETIFSPPPPPQPEVSLPPNKDEIIKQLQEEIRRLNEENQQLQKEITILTSKMQELQSKQ